MCREKRYQNTASPHGLSLVKSKYSERWRKAGGVNTISKLLPGDVMMQKKMQMQLMRWAKARKSLLRRDCTSVILGAVPELLPSGLLRTGRLLENQSLFGVPAVTFIAVSEGLDLEKLPWFAMCFTWHR